MKEPLKGMMIAITGDFGIDRSQEKMKQWIETNGGKFALKIDSDTTHLICSLKQARETITIVKTARKVKNLKVVTFDWLEDSLLKRSPRRVTDYLVTDQLKMKSVKKAKRFLVRQENIKKGIEKFEKNCDEFKSIMHSGGYHIYRDPTGFAYDITLARADLVTNQNERYHLKLYESHVAPSLYACYVTFSSPKSKPASHILAPLASSFELSISNFTRFFELKTKKTWDNRHTRTSTEDEDVFAYAPPAAHLPQGMVADAPDIEQRVQHGKHGGGCCG